MCFFSVEMDSDLARTLVKQATNKPYSLRCQATEHWQGGCERGLQCICIDGPFLMNHWAVSRKVTIEGLGG